MVRKLYGVLAGALGVLLVVVAYFVLSSGGVRASEGARCALPPWDANYYPGARLIEGNGWEYYIMVFEANSPSQEPVGAIVFSRLAREYNTTVKRCSNGLLLYDVSIREGNPRVGAYGICSVDRCTVFVFATCGDLPPAISTALRSCSRTSP